METRRLFLQKASLSAMALAVPALTPLSAMTNSMNTPAKDSKTLRVAIMGLGSYGTRVAEAIQDCERVKLVGVISGTPSKIEDWKSNYNIPAKNCYNYDNFDAIKDNPDIDAVYVITPNALHKDQVIRVAKAGKHAICEKPMATSAEDGQAMVDACKAAGVHLLIGYRMHFEPNTLEVIRMRKDGELGDVRFFQGLCGFEIGNPNQWRMDRALSGGGAMMDIGIYAINGARYMIGDEPIWVTAQEVKTNPEKFKEGLDETITFQLGFPNGVIASCLSTYNMNNLDRFFLNGSKGWVEMQPSTGYGPIKGQTHKGPLNEPIVTHQTVQMDEMAAIIFDGKNPEVPVNGEEGVKDMKIIDAIFRAVETGGKVPLNLG
ncbi:putative dehydrogenase [Algoriphagus sp. 4150]|uniref:Gfo/Idh/MocA family protein n=1 Tax=Algoriphagus sp. 4150 TaxID=2817756 RepID=UPI00285468D9|nr:Gfo/Idh/MocA family oxidoreductase [Algoriphagus sp. 4150]MDR7132578.1 putative dehydrogenase [Algoriphagus sp. 4150]